MISATEMLGSSGAYAPRENFEKINAISLSLKRVPLLIIKHFDFSYTLVGYTLAMGYFAHREILEDMFQLMRFYHILHKNSIAWSLIIWIPRNYFRHPPPPQKVSEKNLTIYLLYVYIHF